MSKTPALLMPFDTDDPEFTRGFEAGQLWARLETERLRPEGLFTVLIHANNGEMAQRCATAHGFTLRMFPLDATWTEAQFERAEKEAPDIDHEAIC